MIRRGLNILLIVVLAANVANLAVWAHHCAGHEHPDIAATSQISVATSPSVASAVVAHDEAHCPICHLLLATRGTIPAMDRWDWVIAPPVESDRTPEIVPALAPEHFGSPLPARAPPACLA